ncbi:MAG: DUF4082 domain-containing protein [Bdellovibrio sp.]
MKKMVLKQLFSVICFLGISSVGHAACDQTLSPGNDIAAAVTNAPNGSTICLNSGNYGAVALTNITRTGYVTLTSVSGTGALMSPSLWATNFVRFDHMSLTDMITNHGCSDIQILNSVFLPNRGGLALVDTKNALVDNCDFTQSNMITWSGRLTLNNVSYSTVKNCKFVGVGKDSVDTRYGAADGIMIIGGANNNIIGPNNLFSGILQSLCDVANPGSHCDAIQFYGSGSNNTVTGNYFVNGDTYIMSPDGVDGVTMTNNVFDGSTEKYDWKIQFGSANGVLFEHNTLINTGVAFDSKTGNPASTNILAKNNIIRSIGIKTSGGSGCSPNCVFTHNMFDTTGYPGTDNIAGIPNFVGGANPNTQAGFQLTSSSIGYKSALDGLDMGISYYGSGASPAPAQPSSLVAASNLRSVSISDTQIQMQFDYSGSSQSGFIVMRKTGTNSYAQIALLNATTLAYTDSSVSASTSYCYVVQAYNSTIISANSNELCVTTLVTPVVVQPAPSGSTATLGYTSVGTSVDSADSNSINASRFVMGSQDGTASSMSIYAGPTISAAPNNQYQVAIYADANGLPGSLVASSAPSTLIANSWNKVTISAPLKANAVYWLAYNANGLSNSANNIRYSAGSANQTRWMLKAFGSMPSTFTNSGTGTGGAAVQMSIYVSYSVSSVTSASQSQTLLTTQIPANLQSNDKVNYEMGMRFYSTQAGKISSIRFYKSAAETGTHVGKIYSSSGQLLGQVTFTNESASGWQQADLATPIAITANTEYTVSVNTGNMYYVDTVSGMASQISNGSLRSVVNGNGVYGPVGSRPTKSWSNSNYFRDIVFVPSL